MEPKKLLESDYLDIVFDKRNKEYGGYELRKHYARRVKKAGLFALLGISALFSFSFIATRERVVVITSSSKADTLSIIQTLPEKPLVQPQQPYNPPPPPTPPAKSFSEMKVTDDAVMPDQQLTEVKDLHDANPGPTNSKGDSSSIGSSVGPGTGPAVVQPAVNPGPEMPKMWVEQMPQFNGDLEAYLSAHLVYPEQARAAGIQGTVGIKFVVNEDGSLTDIQVIRSIGGGCDEAAIKVLSGMPKWKPGKQNCRPVKVYFKQAFTFRLQ